MKFISLRMHGVIDYILSILLIASPWLFNYYRDGTETWFPVVLGLLAIIIDLMTDYDYSMVRTITPQNNLILDFLSGVLLAASPWIFGFNEYIFMPHVVFGTFQVLLSLTTEIQNRGRVITYLTR